MAEWRAAEGWYGTLTKAHSHLCADLNDDVRALPRCPLAVGLLKSKLSWLHSCLGRTEAAADKSQVVGSPRTRRRLYSMKKTRLLESKQQEEMMTSLVA